MTSNAYAHAHLNAADYYAPADGVYPQAAHAHALPDAVAEPGAASTTAFSARTPDPAATAESMRINRHHSHEPLHIKLEAAASTALKQTNKPQSK